MNAGFSGYGFWSISSAMGLNQTAGYMHVAAAMNKALTESQKDVDPPFQEFHKSNGSPLSTSYSHPIPCLPVQIGSTNSAVTSRVFRKAEWMSRTALRDMVGVAAGNPEEVAFSVAELFGDGRVLL
ncbi:hypothetical protein N7491_008020 [Penicillium cf. griseofulvum]|uniref:Uncharacterized protein n=1 Tax=Penicillium cf. griseofulvum TaxID=2972120 RepID=A0A9W9M5Y1_9EURO|nr:hypothetical protein N7472_008953 [Penicillium cf. griseofulvum]KAJ5427578.1 hypothetical protein N7491_008020 [Penicillium cf. griseofulvum]KAJ5431775.1 hypothetical protein N7445_008273 [Penicillium cf. griseofulvum]